MPRVMLWRWLGIWVVVGSVLAACQRAGTLPPALPATPQPKSSPTPVAITAATPSCQLLAPTVPTPHQPTYLLENDHRLGPLDAEVVLVVYGDYQCEPCARLDARLWQLRQEFPKTLLWVYRHFPLVPLNDKALMAVQAAEAAARQNRFWEVHRYLYTRQTEWRDLPPQDFPQYILAMARELGLDLGRFTQDLTDPEIQGLAYRAWQVGQTLGLDAAPTVFLNGEWFPGPFTYPGLRTVVALTALEARRLGSCPPWVLEEDRLYRLVLWLEQGQVEIVLEPTWAPAGVNAVVVLAQQGWYQGMGIYQVLPGQAVFFGDPSNTGYGHPGFLIPWEAPSRPPRPGTVVLQPASPGWNTPRMAVLLNPAGARGEQVTAIGRVVRGLSLLQSLPALSPQQDPYLPLAGWRLEITPLDSSAHPSQSSVQ